MDMPTTVSMRRMPAIQAQSESFVFGEASATDLSSRGLNMSRCLGDLLGHAECGMSGTSVLGFTLGKQPSVANRWILANEMVT